VQAVYEIGMECDLQEVQHENLGELIQYAENEELRSVVRNKVEARDNRLDLSK